MTYTKGAEARQQAENALAELAAALRAGKSEALTAYLDAVARFRRYSIHNVTLIFNAMPDAQDVRGFREWQRHGRQVKKGEKGIAIIAPVVVRRKKDTRKGKKDKDARALAGFRAAYVFDISQTEGRPLLTFAKVSGEPGEYTKRLKMYVAAQGIALEYVASIDNNESVNGRSKGGLIQIRNGLTVAEEFSVLVHELAHERLHHQGERKSTKCIRETEAESVAYVVSRAIGLDSCLASTEYIHAYDGDAQTLAGSLDAVRRVASEIIEAIRPENAYSLLSQAA